MADVRPTPAVGVCVLRPGDDGPDVLLIRRANPPNAGSWSFPGGRQRYGELLEDAARRELWEETAVSVGALTLVAALDVIAPGAFHYVVVDYAAAWRGDTPRAGDDAADVCWWPVRSLTARPVTPAIAAVARTACAALSFA